MRLLIIFAMVAWVSCGSRTASNPDTGALDSQLRAEGVTQSDGRIRKDTAPDLRRADLGVAPTCTSLSLASQVSLESADTMKLGTKVAFDGTRFGVIWHSQSPMVSSLNGELRFAAVDLAGSTTASSGVVLDTDNASLRPALAPRPAGGFSVLHQQVLAMGVPGVSLKTLDATGKTSKQVFVNGAYYHAAVTSHPSGNLLFLATQFSPDLILVDANGSVSTVWQLTSAQVMSSLWLGQSSTGYAAGSATTNANATLSLLNASLTGAQHYAVGNGGVKQPSFVVLDAPKDVRYGALYETAGKVELERYDSQGQSLGQSLVASGIDGPSGLGLAWNGAELAAVYATVPGQYRVQLLDTSGGFVGTPIQVPSCLATGSNLSVVWGKDRLAVVAVSSASGVMKSAVCVTLMACK